MSFRRSSLVDKLMLRMSEHIELDGLWIGVLAEPEDTILARLGEALVLIRENDPYRYRLVRAEIARIWAYPLPGDGTDWVARDKRCIIDPRLVQGESIERIAATIIHEAAHARFSRCGVQATDYVRRQQIDRACLRQELAFAARLPDGLQLREWIDARMARPADFWAARSVQVRQSIGESELVAYAQLPRWAVHAALTVRRFRTWMRL